MTATLLAEATVQDVQLELLRRTSFNNLVGAKVADSLLLHRDLWESAMLTRPGIPIDPRRYPSGCLIPLRDLPRKVWNADLLVVLCPTRENADKLRTVADEERWDADEYSFAEGEDMADAIGHTSRSPRVVFSAWWD